MATASVQPVCRQNTDSSRKVAVAPSQAMEHDLERRNNLVVFGLEEKNSTLETKSDVKDLFHHLVDRDVRVEDAIRLGRRGPRDRENPVRPRPLLLKLMCLWDCCIVLASKHRLRGYGDGKIFVHPDRTLEERCKDKEH